MLTWTEKGKRLDGEMQGDPKMRGPKPAPLSLAEDERRELERLVRRHATTQQVALRAWIILEADAGKNYSQIARELSLTPETVRAWRKSWLSEAAVSMADRPIQERLSDEPRPGRKNQITAEQTCQVIALACEQPKERPISHWTGRELANEITRQGIITQISPLPLLMTCKPKYLLLLSMTTRRWPNPSSGPIRAR
jgi:transposase